MCGIAGFLDPGATLTPAAAEATARAMADAIAHRGPDSNGAWCDAEAGIGLGFRRLAIIDLSPAGNQPMLSRDGRFAVIQNGEIYNHNDIRRALELDAGAAWRGHSDTEVLVEAIAEWGIDRALEAVNGMFALAVWDRDTRSLALARDRMGEKPLYYGWSGGRAGGVFLFGSELRALAAHPAWAGEIDRGALDLLLRYDYVPGPYSIFAGIRKLPPGHMITITAGAAAGDVPAPRPYWSAAEAAAMAMASPFQGGADEAEEALDALLREAVAMRLEADVPLGAFLSGGIDSSTVVALAQAASARPVKTFTIGFEDKRFDEAPQAAAVARHLGTEHTELYLREADALAAVMDLPAVYDEPFADISQIPTLLLARLTRRHVTVGLSGDGGDELFGGYPRYARLMRRWASIGGVPAPVRALARSISAVVPTALLDGALGWPTAAIGARRRRGRPGTKLQRALADWGAGSPEALYRRMVARWDETETLVPGAPHLPSVLDGAAAPDGASAADRAMLLDALGYLPDDLLVKIDRATMSVGLEGRAPLLDHRIVEFAWSLPVDLKLRDAGGKWILRRVLARHVPSELTERPKAGFDPPLESWLRGPLHDWAAALLDRGAVAREGLIDPGPVATRWHEHAAGARNHRHELWGVLAFRAWHAQWRDAMAKKQQPRAELARRAGA